MYFTCKPHSTVPGSIEDWCPLFHELPHRIRDHFLLGSRVTRDIAPDWRASETAHDTGAKPLRQAKRRHHLFRSTLLHTCGRAIAPHINRHEGLVAFVDGIANRLPNLVIGDDRDLQIVS